MHLGLSLLRVQDSSRHRPAPNAHTITLHPQIFFLRSICHFSFSFSLLIISLSTFYNPIFLSQSLSSPIYLSLQINVLCILFFIHRFIILHFLHYAIYISAHHSSLQPHTTFLTPLPSPPLSPPSLHHPLTTPLTTLLPPPFTTSSPPLIGPRLLTSPLRRCVGYKSYTGNAPKIIVYCTLLLNILLNHL